ncbi:DUF4433 domain-containing protein [Leptolyngbyaceae cyanobacterium CCMR0082]|uniref:DUF4433 domain-containing protein n=1 Tax=Adonisia turfae CCMR0082 TaxID=2304604 RepID=A0A6M0S0J7_9CYAN|nr:DarT ssDNA thymidine ADP-ribosyltransferase family protein [Adonisia turfae]NEZ61977.1 DUF4433 domain-containing protein [Adonisia turfae CCMR0082]
MLKNSNDLQEWGNDSYSQARKSPFLPRGSAIRLEAHSTAEEDEVPRKIGIEGLFYITHIDNVPSILEKGILCHEEVERSGVKYEPIYDSQIVSNRQSRTVSGEKGLWHYANLYFQPRNAMLYRIVNNTHPGNIAILFIKPEIINRDDVFITNGNAASPASEIYPAPEGRRYISSVRKEIDREWWSNVDGTKRKMMAECLVPKKVPPDCIRAIYVASDQARDKIASQMSQKIEVVVDSNRFFQPQWTYNVAPNLSLIKGDMFLSRMQTLTVSVNCVGVMGKGLASTTKYRFPDVYVKYQDICRNNAPSKTKLRMGRPYLHRRETSVLYDLSDDPSALQDTTLQTWFLIFPTKNHWKENSDFNGIEAGLKWVLANYEREGIRSLALPALGCGLGKLKWSDVGPMMCKYLAKMSIPVEIYLPIDRETPQSQLTKNFLLTSDSSVNQLSLDDLN